MFCVCFVGGRCRLRGEFLLCRTAVPFRCVPFGCTRSHASVHISVLTSLSASGLAVSNLIDSVVCFVFVLLGDGVGSAGSFCFVVRLNLLDVYLLDAQEATQAYVSLF